MRCIGCCFCWFHDWSELISTVNVMLISFEEDIQFRCQLLYLVWMFSFTLSKRDSSGRFWWYLILFKSQLSPFMFSNLTYFTLVNIQLKHRISVWGESIWAASSSTWVPGSNITFHQWEFQDPKMEVLYHIRPYVVGILPYIGLIYGRYLHFRFLKISDWFHDLDGWQIKISQDEETTPGNHSFCPDPPAFVGHISDISYVIGEKFVIMSWPNRALMKFPSDLSWTLDQ